MSVDYTELKRLAEAATPGRNFDRLPMAGGGLKYECTGDDGSLVLKVDHKNDEWGFVGDNSAADEEFFLACTPAQILALIAENERLVECLKTANSQAEHFERNWYLSSEENENLNVEVGVLRKFLLDASEEIDSWGSYASDYFRGKYDHAGCVAKFRTSAMGKEQKP